jgi:FkbM family methyltransferase
MFIRNMALKLSRLSFSGFEYLLLKKRYRKISVNLLGRPFEIADGVSFYWSHKEIFIDEIYKFRCDSDNPVILDCGSNYGTSILYFKSIYPNSTITGIEADPEIFKILKKNINNRYSDISLLNKAISNKKGPIKFYTEGADGGRAHKINDSSQTNIIDAISLDILIDKKIDFLKMDIEGAETDVLCDSKNLKNVQQLFIEYHSFVDERQKLGDLLTVLSKNDFRFYIHTQLCSKKPLLEDKTQLGMDLQLNIFAKRYKD